MTLTPTAQSSAMAGFALWVVAWMFIFKMDKLPYIGKFLNKDKLLDWIARDKSNMTLTFIGTEVFNFGVHGISNPASVTFALGGSGCNSVMIGAVLPIRKKLRDRKRRKAILKGASI